MTIGLDIVNINRIKKILETNREKFYGRIFTHREVEYINMKNHSGETISGLFAAKEAVSKVIGKGIGEINWKDLEVLHNDDGKPYLNLNEKIKKMIKELNLKHIEISISHERDYAIAFALGVKESNMNYLDEIVVEEEFLNIIKKRKADSHKGTYGKALLIGGSSGMTGSMTLSSRACMRSGVGLTYTLVPKSLDTIMSIKLTEEIIKTAEDDGMGHFIRNSIEDILEALKDMDAVAIGPGMGENIHNPYILEALIKNTEVPIVIDADGINTISKDENILINRSSRNNKIVITPHPGELSRLIGVSIEEIQKNKIFYSKYTSEKYNVIVVLKGNNTIVCHEDNIYINHTGNPGMATAGSGDVLTGIITSFIAQGFDPFFASKLAVYIHGLGGDLASHRKGEYGIIASDIVESIAYIIQMIVKRGN